MTPALLQWEWHLVRATRDRPFVTSDWPVFAQLEPGQAMRLVSFPVSSEVALVIIGGGQFNRARDTTKEVYAMNRQTMHRATEFVVACKNEFPADEYLVASCPRV